MTVQPDRKGRVGSDILVSTLRDASKRLGGWWTYDGSSDPDLHLLLHEAADEIESLRKSLLEVVSELGVPSPDYAAPVANAIALAKANLDYERTTA